MLSLFHEPTESADTVVRTWKESWRQQFGLLPHRASYLNTATEDSLNDQPTLLIFGNSFTSNFLDRTDLPNHFSKIHFNKSPDFRELPQLAYDGIDIVLLMFHPTPLVTMIEDGEWWPALD